MGTSAEEFTGSSSASLPAKRSRRSSSTSPVKRQSGLIVGESPAETTELMKALRPLTRSR